MLARLVEEARLAVPVQVLAHERLGQARVGERALRIGFDRAFGSCERDEQVLRLAAHGGSRARQRTSAAARTGSRSTARPGRLAISESRLLDRAHGAAHETGLRGPTRPGPRTRPSRAGPRAALAEPCGVRVVALEAQVEVPVGRRRSASRPRRTKSKASSPGALGSVEQRTRRPACARSAVREVLAQRARDAPRCSGARPSRTGYGGITIDPGGARRVDPLPVAVAARRPPKRAVRGVRVREALGRIASRGTS